MTSAGTSLRFPQLGHRIARLSLGSRDDKDLIVLGVVHDHQLLVSFLSDEDFPLSLSDARSPVLGAQRLPQIGLIPVPFPHPRVPEVLAHVHVDLVDVEREQNGSLSYVMNFIYMKVETRSENPWHSELSRTLWYRLIRGFVSWRTCQQPQTSGTSTSTTGGSSATTATHSPRCRRKPSSRIERRPTSR